MGVAPAEGLAHFTKTRLRFWRFQRVCRHWKSRRTSCATGFHIVNGSTYAYRRFKFLDRPIQNGHCAR